MPMSKAEKEGRKRYRQRNFKRDIYDHDLEEHIPHNYGLGVSDCFESQDARTRQRLHEVIEKADGRAFDGGPRYWDKVLASYGYYK